MSHATFDAAAPPEPSAEIPIFSRTATGLVRQVSLLQQIVFNLASSNALGQGLVFFLSVVVLFPRANIYVALLIAAFGSFFVWTTFGLLSAAIPRSGGDYTINSRVLPPWMAAATAAPTLTQPQRESPALGPRLGSPIGRSIAGDRRAHSPAQTRATASCTASLTQASHPRVPPLLVR